MQQHEPSDALFGASNDVADSILAALGAAPYDIDLRSGQLYPSPRLNRLLGFPVEHRLTLADSNGRIFSTDRTVLEQAVATALSDGSRRFQCDYRLALPGGGVRWVRAAGVVVADADGQPVRLRAALILLSNYTLAAHTLHESGALFRQMADTLPQMIWITDTTGQVRFLNQRWYDYSGTPRESIAVADIAARSLHPDDGPRVLAAFAEGLRTGQGFEIEQRNRSAAGSYRWFLNCAEPYRDPQTGEITLWFGVGVDIDDRKRLEEALRVSETRHALLLQFNDALRPLSDATAIQATVAELVLHHFAADHCYYCEIERENAIIRQDAARYALPSMIGTYAFTSLPIVRAGLAAGQPLVVPDATTREVRDEALRQSYPHLQPNTAISLPVYRSGEPRGVLCITQHSARTWSDADVELAAQIAERTWDALERARAEAALRASEARLRLSLDVAGLGTWSWNLATGVGELDARCAAIVGMPAGSFANGAALQRERVHQDDIAALEATIQAGTASGQPFELDYRVIHPDGSTHVIASRVLATTDATGAPAELIGISRDATAERQVAERLRTSQEYMLAALEGGQLGAWSWSPVTNQAQADARTLALFGVEAPFFNGDATAIFARIHSDDLPAVNGALVQAQQPGGEYRTEFRVTLPDGQERWLAGVGRGRFAGDGQLQQIYGVNFDITARKHAEGDTQLLAKLAELIAGTDDAELLQIQVATLVGQHLGVTRCLFAEIDTVHQCWFAGPAYADGVPPLTGAYPLADYPAGLIALISSGQILVSNDMTREPLTAAVYARAEAPLDARAYVVVPLLRQRQWVSNLAVFHAVPREWQERDIDLLTTVAERTWQAVERVRAERALRDSEARLQIALDSTGLGTFVWHLAEQRAESDARLLALFGLPPDDTSSPAEVLSTLVHQDDRAQYTAALQRAVDPQGDGRMYAELRVLQPDGSLRWVAMTGQADFSGQPRQAVRLAGVIADISARKQSEAQLAAAAARDQYLVRLADALRPLSDAVAIEQTAIQVLGEQLGAARVAYFEVDGGDYVVERYYAVGVRSPTGRFPSSAFGATQLALYRAGRPVIEPDVVANPELHSTEREVYASYQIAAHVGVPLVKDGRFIAGLAVHHTVPHAWTADELALIEETAERTWAAIQRARAEARLQALYAQEQAARKAAEEASQLKDEFLATISHELRTPLTALLGYTGLLQRRQRDAAYVERTLQKMAQSAQAQAVLIEDLLDMSRIISGKLRIEPEPIDLIAVIHAAVDTVRPTLDAKQQTLELTLDPAARAVLGDANRLQQVVWNLLANAAKFSPPGSAVAVELAPAGTDAALVVRDTGQGIKAAFIPYVFDRFRQADSTSQRSHGGLGLGLAIVRHLIELHGGSVGAVSAGVNMGAAFTVRLPLAAAPKQRASEPPVETGVLQDERHPLSGVQVLVVDDQPAVLDLLEELLTVEGATVRGCHSASDALTLLDGWLPDLLISDIAMPGADGYWLIDQLRRRPPERGGALPALALTAYVRMEDRLRVLGAGFQQYLTKPIDADELRSVVLHLVHPDQPR